MASQESQKKWTILSLIQWSENYLTEKRIDSPRLNAELMLAAALNCKRIDLYTRFDKPLVQEELDHYKTLFVRRLNREPLQYILGYADFYGRRFAVRPGVLIPRPETEHIIEAVLEIIKEKEIKSPRILDIGTGSGCIAVSLAAEIDDAMLTAIDVSEDTLEIAKQNAVQHLLNGRITFQKVDILDRYVAVPEAGSFDFIAANPPYIPKKEWDSLQDEIRLHEPKHALTDDDDGLTYYKRITGLAPQLLKNDGWLICEIGHDQYESVRMLIESKGAREIRHWNDLSGIKRIIGGNW